ASAAIVTYARQPGDPKLAESLQGLARPSLGQWWEFARTLVPVLAERGTAGYPALSDLLLGKTRDDLPRTAGLDAALREALGQAGAGRSTIRRAELFDHLVTYRNKMFGHGALGRLRDDVHRRMASALLLGMGELLAKLDVLAGLRLLQVGEVRQVG